MNITKEKIDDIFMTATKHNLLDLENQLINALEEISELKDNPIAREILAASIVQGNIMAALKEVCYMLFLENE